MTNRAGTKGRTIQTSSTGKTPSVLYRELTERFGDPAYARVDAALSS